MDEKAIRGIPWTLLTYAATRVISVLTTIVLARLLAPSDFGLFALATLGTGLLSIFSGLWLGASLIVKPDLDDRGKGTILTLLLASGVLLAATLAALAPLFADLFREERLTEILWVLASILLFSGVGWFYETVLQRELEFRRRFLSQIIRTAVYSAVALGLGFAGVGVWSLVIAHFVGHVANVATLMAMAPYRVRPTFDRGLARETLRTSHGFLAQDLALFLQENVDYISIGRILGSSSLGYYSMAFRQAELPHYALADPLAKVTFPAFAQMRHRGEDVGPAFLTGLRLVALVTCPLGVILSGAAEPFTATLFGEKWLPMVGPLAVLGIWALMRPLQVTVGYLLNSLGHASVYGRTAMFSLPPFALATFLAADRGGLTAVAWVLLAYIFIIWVVLMFAAQRHADVGVREQLKVLRPLAVASALAWLATRGVADLTGDSDPLLSLVAAVAACLGAYLTSVRLLDPALLPLALRQAKRAVGRAPSTVAP